MLDTDIELLPVCDLNASSKEKILLAAQSLFGEIGYSQTTFKRIAEESGVAPGLINHHFKTKERLFVACSLDVLERLRRHLEPVLQHQPNGLEAAMAFVVSYLEYSVTPGTNFIILVQCSPYSHLAARLDMREVTVRFQGLIAMLEECMARGMKDGSVRKDDPKVLADAVQATIVGSVRTRLLAPFCPEGFYETVFTFIRKGLEPCEGDE